MNASGRGGGTGVPVVADSNDNNPLAGPAGLLAKKVTKAKPEEETRAMTAADGAGDEEVAKAGNTKRASIPARVLLLHATPPETVVGREQELIKLLQQPDAIITTGRTTPKTTPAITTTVPVSKVGLKQQAAAVMAAAEKATAEELGGNPKKRKVLLFEELAAAKATAVKLDAAKAAVEKLENAAAEKLEKKGADEKLAAAKAAPEKLAAATATAEKLAAAKAAAEKAAAEELEKAAPEKLEKAAAEKFEKKAADEDKGADIKDAEGLDVGTPEMLAATKATAEKLAAAKAAAEKAAAEKLEKDAAEKFEKKGADEDKGADIKDAEVELDAPTKKGADGDKGGGSVGMGAPTKKGADGDKGGDSVGLNVGKSKREMDLICLVCEKVIDVADTTCPNPDCGANFNDGWFCELCNGKSPAFLDACMRCETPAPDGKVPASAPLLRTNDAGALVPTVYGHMAARQGDEEGKGMKIFQGRQAKANAMEKITPPRTTKVQSLTMTKENLVSKLWGEKMKRSELWVCAKAASVTAGSTMVHSAGRFVGEFRVGRARSWGCVRAALEWLGHDTFLPGSPSIEDTIVFYYKLFTGKRADKDDALAWDGENRGANTFVCYAWEDTQKHQYIVHDDGKHDWTYPQEQARMEKKTGVKKETKKEIHNTFRGFTIAGGANLQQHGIEDYDDIMTFKTVTRNTSDKRKTKSILCVGSTAFHACVGGHDRILALTGIVLDTNPPKKMWFSFTSAWLPLTAKSKYTSVWVVASMLPKAWVWTPVPFPSGAIGFMLSDPKDLIADFIENKGAPEDPFSKLLQNSTEVVSDASDKMDTSSDDDEVKIIPPVVKGKRRRSGTSKSRPRKSESSNVVTKETKHQQNEFDKFRAEMKASIAEDAQRAKMATESQQLTAETKAWRAEMKADDAAQGVAAAAGAAAAAEEDLRRIVSRRETEAMRAEAEVLRAELKAEQKAEGDRLRSELAATRAATNEANLSRIEDFKEDRKHQSKLLELAMKQGQGQGQGQGHMPPYFQQQQHRQLYFQQPQYHHQQQQQQLQYQQPQYHQPSFSQTMQLQLPPQQQAYPMQLQLQPQHQAYGWDQNHQSQGQGQRQTHTDQGQEQNNPDKGQGQRQDYSQQGYFNNQPGPGAGSGYGYGAGSGSWSGQGPGGVQGQSYQQPGYSQQSYQPQSYQEPGYSQPGHYGNQGGPNKGQGPVSGFPDLPLD
jgi:hypothetical protein